MSGRGDEATTRFGLVKMVPRDPAETGRGVSNLELLFDLVFAVAVGVCAEALGDLEAHANVVQAVGSYLMVFFAIWWAWMNFTWFSSSFDTDDWLYRVMTIVQMGGALVIATGARRGILHQNFDWVVVGYVIMRAVAIPGWLRVAHSSPDYRTTALRYAGAIFVVQVLWVLRQPVAPHVLQVPSFIVMVLCELMIPVFAERARQTPWHPHHLADRYGAFTIILLGEAIATSANAVLAATDSSTHLRGLVTIAALGLVIIAAMWWIYFARPTHELISDLRSTMVFGYFHYVIFAAAGAVSAGIAIAVGRLEHDITLNVIAARAALAVPVALYFHGVWWLSQRGCLPRWANAAAITLAGVIAASILTPYSMTITALAAAAIVIVVEVSG